MYYLNDGLNNILSTMAKRQKVYNLSNYDKLIAVALLLASIVCIVSVAFFRGVNADEREHLYATWLVWQGELPYKDFFEHHHPLLWYIISPLLNFYDNSSSIWYVLRSIMFVMSLGSGYFIYKICRLLGYDTTASIVATSVWLFLKPVQWSGTEYRPDNLMIFFFIIGLYSFLIYLKQHEILFLYLSALVLFLSICALQKACIIIFPIVMSVLWGMKKREIPVGDVVLSVVFPVALGLTALFIFWRNGALRDYFELNWLFNADLLIENPYSQPPAEIYTEQVLGILSAFWLYWKNKREILLHKLMGWYIVSVVIVLGILPSLLKMPLWNQYFLLLCPYIAVAVGGCFYSLAQNFKAEVVVNFAGRKRNCKFHIGLYPLMVCISVIYLIGRTEANVREGLNAPFSLQVHTGLERIIQQLSSPKDRIVCNIDLTTVGGMRRCVQGYYWFSAGLSARHHFNFHGRPLPDINSLIKARLPKIVMNTNFEECSQNEESGKLECKKRELDTEWMKDYYYNNGFIFTRKY